MSEPEQQPGRASDRSYAVMVIGFVLSVVFALGIVAWIVVGNRQHIQDQRIQRITQRVDPTPAQGRKIIDAAIAGLTPAQRRALGLEILGALTPADRARLGLRP